MFITEISKRFTKQITDSRAINGWKYNWAEVPYCNMECNMLGNVFWKAHLKIGDETKFFRNDKALEFFLIYNECIYFDEIQNKCVCYDYKNLNFSLD